MKKRLIGGLLLLSCMLHAPHTEAQQRPHLEGHYYDSYKKGIVLWFSEVFIHVSNTGDYLFSLALGASHPLYTTSQQIYGRLSLNKHTGHYEYLPTDSTLKCAFEFVRQDSILTVSALNCICTFSSLALRRVNAANPDSFRYRDGRISFSTPPESFRFEYKWRDLVGGDDY